MTEMLNNTKRDHEDEVKMPEINTTGLVFLGIFSLLFVMTCILSAVKAVKDRKKIKARIEAKRRHRLEQSAYENPENGTLQNGLEEEPMATTEKVPNDSDIHSTSLGSNSHSKVFRTVSADDVAIMEKNKTNTYSMNKNVPKSNLSSSVPDLNHGNILSPECLAVKKQIRRTSYAIAVDSFSWLPKDQPKFAKTENIIQTYNLQPGTTKSYENKAFDPHDIH